MSTDQNPPGDAGDAVRRHGPVAVPHRRDPAGGDEQWDAAEQWPQDDEGTAAWEGEETAWGGASGAQWEQQGWAPEHQDHQDELWDSSDAQWSPEQPADGQSRQDWQQAPQQAGGWPDQQWSGQWPDPQGNQQPGPQQPGPQQPGIQQPGRNRHEAAQEPGPPAEVTVRPNMDPPPGLNDASLLTHRKAVSSRGWRRAVSAMTFGAVKPGLSPAEIAEAQQLREIRTPIRGCHRIGVVSLKGGIGKTTTAAGLGLALATSRGDGVIAVDANPDAGTLADRLVGSAPSPYSGAEWVGAHVRANDDVWIAPRSVRDLLAAVAADEIGSATDVMRYVSIAGRLHVLASEQDPETSEAFSAHEYRTTAEVISAFYSVMITDTGTGLLHSAMAGMLSVADSLVIIAAPSVDGASRAAKTLDWLDAHHYGHLVSRAVVAVSHTRPRAQNVDIKVLDQHFGARCRDVVHIPYDPHLVAGAVIRWDEMATPTRAAFLRLAASVALDFRESWNSENPADDMR